MRDALTERRDRITALRRDRDGIVSAAALVAVDDEHDPEGATVGYERAHVDALLTAALDRLDELDAALARLDAGHYGTCTACGAPIPAGRLTARPETRHCLTCAARR
ncbi:TraR/DksA family transcriptional regulator [Actinomadura atramentaria]|uniref:TraR/DksA family transcriptional regulator n=1 Tax=Actinomadura atramentaria TaxID=1990 RepID=UPI000371B512|nr:TraR/DksA C4-type zinc finger protein [Actinomadura atramentaria]